MAHKNKAKFKRKRILTCWINEFQHTSEKRTRMKRIVEFRRKRKGKKFYESENIWERVTREEIYFRGINLIDPSSIDDAHDRH